MKTLLYLLLLSAAYAINYEPTNLKVQQFGNCAEAWQAASRFIALKPGRTLHGVRNTGSMRPYITTAGFFVVDPTPYADLKNGMMPWAECWNGRYYLHVAIVKDRGGWITSGTGPQNKHSDTNWRVTPERYKGEVIAFFGYGPPVVLPPLPPIKKDARKGRS